MEVNKESSHHQYHEVNPTKTLFGKLAVIFVGLRIIQQRSVRGRNYVSCVVLLIIVLQTARGRAFLEYGSELCVAQVLDHSFFHIGETY